MGDGQEMTTDSPTPMRTREADVARHAACPICSLEAQAPFFEMPAMPAVCNQLFPAAEPARAMPRGDVTLCFCPDCGFIFNQAFDPARVPYGAHYENSLHFSPSFQAHAESLARRLIERYSVRGGRVVEIACGNGEFLSLLCCLGDNEGIGYDPSGVVDRAGPGAQDRMEIRTRFFEEADASERTNLICCRHALEHMEDPVSFLRMVRRGLSDDSETVLYFEVPNSAWILEEFDLWDLIYEHFGYFTRPSLTQAFTRAGFEVLDVGEDFGRQFLWVEARPAAREGAASADLAELPLAVERFAQTCDQRVGSWREWLEKLHADGQQAVVWGAGSKGTTFANLFREARALSRVVDVNPHKEGMYVSGTGHRIVHPERLAEGGAPDFVIVMNPMYLQEVREMLLALGLSSECRVA